MKVNVYKVREGAKLPVRAHPTDAGMDLFYCPGPDMGFTTIHPGCSEILGTGLKISVPEGYMLQIMNKSGIASKRGLITGACVVDCGYDGEIFVNLQNIGKEVQMLEYGQKIAQAVFVRIAQPSLVEISKNEIYEKSTSRGSGALGSTGDF